MLKVKISVGSTYCGCPDEEIEFEYDGTQEEFDKDHVMSTEILNALMCNEFSHYYMHIDCEEIDEDEDDEEDDDYEEDTSE